MAVGRIDIEIAANPRALIDGLTVAETAVSQATETLQAKQAGINSTLLNFGDAINEVRLQTTDYLGALGSEAVNAAEEAGTGFDYYVVQSQKMSEGILVGIQTFDAFRNVSNLAIESIVSKAPTAGASITAMLGPIGLAVAAVAGLYVVVRTNFDFISGILYNAYKQFTELYNSSTIFRVGVELLRAPFEQLFIVGRGLYEVLKAAFSLDGAGVKKAVEDVNTRLLIAQKNAVLRITGETKIKTPSREEWDAEANKVREFLRIPYPVDKPDSDKLKKGLSEIKKDVESDKITLGIVVDPISLDVANVTAGLAEIDQKYSLVNDSQSALREKTELLKSTLINFGKEGLDSNNASVQSLIAKYKDLIALKDRTIEVETIGTKNILVPLEDYNNKLSSLQRKYSLLNDESGFLSDKKNLLKKTLEDLGTNGFDKNNQYVQGLVNEYKKLSTEAGNAGLKIAGVASPKQTQGRDLLKENGLKFDNKEDLAKDAANIALNIEFQGAEETQEKINAINAKIKENQDILKDNSATQAQKDAANTQISSLEKQKQAEKDKANIFKATTKEIYNTIRERIKAYIADAVAGLIAKEVASKGILGLAIGAAGAGLVLGLFEALVPKLGIGTKEVYQDGFAYLHKGEEVVRAADVATGGNAKNQVDERSKVSVPKAIENRFLQMAITVDGTLSGYNLRLSGQRAEYLESNLI